jgi:hypothetical protein
MQSCTPDLECSASCSDSVYKGSAQGQDGLTLHLSSACNVNSRLSHEYLLSVMGSLVQVGLESLSTSEAVPAAPQQPRMCRASPATTGT